MVSRQRIKEAFPITKKDIKPTVLALVAAGALQERPIKRHEKRAIAKLGAFAASSFEYRPLPTEKLQSLGEVLQKTSLWHGTGRYQRHDGNVVDVLQNILRQGTIKPALDPFDSKLGLAETASLATTRLYGRAYADMHSAQPKNLNRFVSAQQAANFYVVRPALRYIISEARSHPDGFKAAIKQSRAEAAERQSALPQDWRRKVTDARVNTMLTFGVGSDIEGNYPILFGFDDTIPLVDTHAAIKETREVRTEDAVSLSHLTHVEVPYDKVGEVSKLFLAHNVATSVIAIEDMEQFVARRPIEETFLGT